MMERFRRFACADLSLTTPNRMNQVSEVLLETSTVRIILTRYIGRTEDLDVDIEVSLPSLSKTTDATSIEEYIDSMIATLEYLKHLTSIGFGLELLQEEGILIASAVLSKSAEENIFKALEPLD